MSIINNGGYGIVETKTKYSSMTPDERKQIDNELENLQKIDADIEQKLIDLTNKYMNSVYDNFLVDKCTDNIMNCLFGKTELKINRDDLRKIILKDGRGSSVSIWYKLLETYKILGNYEQHTDIQYKIYFILGHFVSDMEDIWRKEKKHMINLYQIDKNYIIIVLKSEIK